jgi:hypothetical protein
MEKQAKEFDSREYLGKLNSNIDTKFMSKEDGKHTTITRSDIAKSRTTVYWKNCKNSSYKVTENVILVKVLIDDCHDCVIDLNGLILTSVVEVWRCTNCVINFDTEVSTLQIDLCNNITLNYIQKKYLGSIIQAGVYNLSISFKDHDELSFNSGFNILKDDPKYTNMEPPLNDKTDQFIIHFVDGILLTEIVVRDSKGFH